MDCVFCDSPATTLDRDMDMWLCNAHALEMGNVVEIELDEVW